MYLDCGSGNNESSGVFQYEKGSLIIAGAEWMEVRLI
jgi:hypothetical protein